MDVRLVAWEVSTAVFVVSAVVYLLAVRHYRTALQRFARRYAKEPKRRRQQSVKLRIPEPPRKPTTTGRLSLVVAVLSFISSVVLGILQLMKH
jgi:hypothetical protein